MGFDMSFLETNLKRKMRENFEQKSAAGAIVRVMQGEKTCFEHAEGFADVNAQTPVTSGSIFRMYSNSKPVTMIALMQLYERGLIFPEDPLSEYFPAFADMPVAVEAPDGSVRYEKQQTPITLRHLYTMTSGVCYPGEDSAAARSMKAAIGKHYGESVTLDDVANIVATEGALHFQPGARWEYGFSHDLLGALIEKVSGMPFGEYLRKNVFEPLRMEDTGFWVPKAKSDRLITAYEVTNGEYCPYVAGDAFTPSFLRPPLYESGGGGLASTLDDYSRFSQMLLGGGEYRGERLLGRKTVEMMTTNQLNDEQLKDFGWAERGYGYGVGMRTSLRPWLLNGSVGEFGWDGMLGTWLAVDPCEGVSVVYLQNMFPYATTGMRLMPIIYAALE